MPGTMTMDELMSGRGRSVYSTDGEKIGSIEEIFVDEDTNQPEWIGLGTGLFGTKRVLVPVEGAYEKGQESRAQVGADMRQGKERARQDIARAREEMETSGPEPVGSRTA